MHKKMQGKSPAFPLKKGEKTGLKGSAAAYSDNLGRGGHADGPEPRGAGLGRTSSLSLLSLSSDYTCGQLDRTRCMAAFSAGVTHN